MSGLLNSIVNSPGRLLAGIVNALNPFRPLAVVVFYLVGAICALTLGLMLPGMIFGVVPELAGFPLAGTLAKDFTDGVLNKILPVWFSVLLFIAVFADIILDFGILGVNVLMSLLFPPEYSFFGQQTGGWRWIPFNPLTTLISQLFDFFKTVAEV